MWFYLTVSLIFLSGLRADEVASSSSIDAEDVLRLVGSFIESRCKKNADEDAFKELQNTADNIRDCINEKYAELITPGETDFSLICKKMPKVYYGCLGNFFSQLEPCLDKEEKYLPDFILSSLNATYQQQCSDDGKILAEQLNTIAACEKGKEVMSSTFGACVPKLKLLEDLLKPEFVINKSITCSNLQSLKECTMDNAKELCKDDSVAKLGDLNFKHFLSWCSEHSSANEVDSD